MLNKLQELTDKLYNEGLSKGKQDGEELLKEAHKKSDEIVAQAKAEAERIVAQAEKDAEELKTKVAADVKMAASQSIAATKQEMEKMLVAKMVGQPVAQALSSPEFMQQMIKSVVAAFNPQKATPTDLELIFPESIKAQVESFVNGELQKEFKNGVKVCYSKKINAGFQVAPKEGGYLLQFTDEEFVNLISAYLRPATKKILFG